MAKKSFNLANRINVVNKYSNVDLNYGPYNSVEEAIDNIPEGVRDIGLTVGVLVNGYVVEYWWKSGVADVDLIMKTNATGSIPVYVSEDDVPSVDDITVPQNVLVASGSSPAFTEDEEKEMMMQAIYELQKEVQLMKRSFTDHMNCGTFEDLKMIIEGNNPDVEAEEPLWASETGEPMVTSSGSTVPDVEPGDPNIIKITHLTIKSGKLEDLISVISYLLPDEMVWAYDMKRLYIKQRDGSLYWLNSMGGDIIITGDTTGSTIDMDNLQSITFVTPSAKKYTLKINDNGETQIINQKTEIAPDFSKLLTEGSFAGYSSDTSNTYLQKLYINSIYCGGIDGESPAPEKYQPCSHNYVELSNLTNNDIGLNNLALRYSINGSVWETLKLEGVVKAQSTFLIRGAACSIMDSNTTKIKVKTYDMEWFDSNSQLIKFSNIKCKFLLEYVGTGMTQAIAVPYKQDGTVAYATVGYIDMVGMNKTGATTPEKIDAYEKTRFEQLVPSSRLYQKYYAMDPVSQATKVIGSRDNNADWIWVELNKDLQPNIENYTPRASYENKKLFYDKTKLSNDAPNMVTVTFGLNAHATRCFNWISTGYYDEYLWYRVSGSTEWTQVESFKSETGVRKYYNRVRVVATDGTPYTAHKLIITGLSPNVYEYKCGRSGYESEVMKFKVVAESNDDFSFVQTTDQQGFNWSEYQVWKKAADFIKDNENPTFVLNTGDMTQNGNRINEWLDYYNAGKRLFDGSDTISGDTFAGVEQMNIIGNNDLSPVNHELIGDGSDLSKTNSINFLFFYTYEIDETNPPVMVIGSNEYYIPSLYSFDYNNCHFMLVNSEISLNTQQYLYENMSVYAFMKNWCEADLSKTTKKWKIAAVHEMPFTIITDALITSYLNDNTIERGGSRINTVVSNINDKYWFSRMLEKHNVRLCIGGHKHTYSCSYPIRENVVTGATNTTFYSMKPIIQVLESTYNYTDISGNTPYKTIFDNKVSTGLCELELVTGITAPMYVMCQATSYKQTSNKELPAENIPWIENYFPASMATGTPVASAGQKYPFYIKWTIKDNQITGDVYKINNIMTSGKFNINNQNTLPLAKLNGNGTSNSQIIINY